MATNPLGILGSEIFTNVILPFVLMFVIIFAILDKTKILGEDKKQINAIVAFIFGLIFTAVPAAVGITTKIIPVIGVIIIILLVFMLMWGFIGGDIPLNDGLKITFGILLGISLIATILWSIGAFPNLAVFFKSAAWAEQVFPAIILVGFIIAVFSVVLTMKSEPKEGKSKK